MKHGYTFKILRGFTFDKGYIFSNYVDALYILKTNSQKGSPNYIIAKLLLNSLYGRFGMNPDMEKHKIVSDKEYLGILSKYRVSSQSYLGNGKNLVSFFDDYSENHDFQKTLNISVATSLIVTASARIHMSEFKTMSGIQICYTDTDSIDITGNLDPKYISDTELGKMKLEHVFDEAVFIAPKVYGGSCSSYEIVKVKGLKNPIPFNELKPLVEKGTEVKVEQQK